MTLTVGELYDAAQRVLDASRADKREVVLAELLADSQLLAEFVLIVVRDGGDSDQRST